MMAKFKLFIHRLIHSLLGKLQSFESLLVLIHHIFTVSYSARKNEQFKDITAHVLLIFDPNFIKLLIYNVSDDISCLPIYNGMENDSNHKCQSSNKIAVAFLRKNISFSQKLQHQQALNAKYIFFLCSNGLILHFIGNLQEHKQAMILVYLDLNSSTCHSKFHRTFYEFGPIILLRIWQPICPLQCSNQLQSFQSFKSPSNYLAMGTCVCCRQESSDRRLNREASPTDTPTGKPPTVIPIEQLFQYVLMRKFAYEVVHDKGGEQNGKQSENVKFIQETSGDKKLFVLKYLLGTAQRLRQVQPKIEKYASLRFAYLSQIHQKQLEANQIILRMDFYEKSLDRVELQTLQKCDKLIILFRIARAIQYLESKGIRHNKIELGNIFYLNKHVELGLPSWNIVKEKHNNTRKLHISAFMEIFTHFFPQNATNEEPIANLIREMKNCSNNQINMESIVKTIFNFNFLDDPKTIEDTKKTIIEYEEGAKYEGEVDENKNKEGYGTMTELESVYWGYWVNNRRSNRGNWKGKDFFYVGEWKNDLRDGFGLEINQLTGQYYEGNYMNGLKNGHGIWQGPNHQIYIGQWKQNKKNGYGIYFEGNNQFYYQGRWKQDMKSGKGKQVHSNGIFYEGVFKDNLKDGQGHYIHLNKFQYKGAFNQNSITGYGIFKDKDGNQYSGDLVNGEYQGRGKYENKEKTYFYIGQWDNGERHGQGQQRTKDTVYIGSFARNIRDGKGTLKIQNEKYNGDFKRGKATGNGQYFYENMDIYRGGFVDMIKEGKGLYISSADGSTYEGFWHNDKKHGKGKHTLKTGEYYDGDWIESKRQGYGKQYSNQQNRYQGYWKNDKKQGKGIQHEGGNKYEGQFKNGLKHSVIATLIFANGDRYEGSFVQNKQQGQGKYTWSNGDEYIGGFVANNRQGQGKMVYLRNGVTYEGGWKKDKRQGNGTQKYKDGQFKGFFANDKKHGPGVRTYVDAEGICKLVGPWVHDMRSGEFDFYFPDKSSQKRQYFNDREINLGMTAI